MIFLSVSLARNGNHVVLEREITPILYKNAMKRSTFIIKP